MKNRQPSIQTINLGYEQMLIIDAGDGSDMRVLHGATWLTGAQASESRFFRAGQRQRQAQPLVKSALRGGMTPPTRQQGWQQLWVRVVTALRPTQWATPFGVASQTSEQA